MVIQFTAKRLYSEETMEQRVGQFIDADKKTKIFSQDVDVFTSEGKLLLKFRKSVLTEKDTMALMRLKGAAVLGATRPDASGIPPEGKYKNIISKSSGKPLHVLTTKAHSGIVGFYDARSNFGYIHAQDPNRACRLTAFTARHVSQYEACLPVFRKIDRVFRRLVPTFYKKQKKAILEIDQEFVIPGTAFTTVTVNRNFRTALHKDSGDFREGFGNLVVCSEGEYQGGFTLFPQYGVGVDCRNGDFLAMDVHEWHCNTSISGEGTRVSFVFYMRDKMRRMCPQEVST